MLVAIPEQLVYFANSDILNMKVIKLNDKKKRP